MAEVGATPKVPAARRRVLKAMQSFFTPLMPDDYLELINPLWSTREMRGRIEHIKQETPDTVTITIRPSFEWEGHRPGQYLRIGIVVNGVHHWRAYSLTSDPGHPEGFISVTPKRVDEGVVSPFLTQHAKPGDIVRLGGVEGEFTLPDPLPEKLFFLSAGSGITPIMSMLRCLARQDALEDVVHLHSARSRRDVTFGEQLRRLDERHRGFRLTERHTDVEPRIKPQELDDLCPDWRDREAFVCGPAELLDAMTEHWESHGDPARLHMERFQPIIGGDPGDGEGGTVKFLRSDCQTECDAGTPILEAGEQAGLDLDYGCRMGICHTCTGTLRSGQLRDLRSGKVFGSEGDTVRICIAAPEGPVELEL